MRAGCLRCFCNDYFVRIFCKVNPIFLFGKEFGRKIKVFVTANSAHGHFFMYICKIFENYYGMMMKSALKKSLTFWAFMAFVSPLLANGIVDKMDGITTEKGCTVATQYMPCSLLPGEQQRKYVVCLPEGYNTSNAAYPVLYLLHGGGCPSSQWVEDGHLKQVVDDLTARGEMVPMVIVCAEANEGGRMIWFNEQEWPYEDYFFQELVPFIESTYRIDSRRGMRSVAGFSMGGGGAVGYGLRHPEMFRVVYAMSAYLRRQPLDFLKNDTRGEWRQNNVERHNPIKAVSEANDRDVARWRMVDWFIDCGDQDFTLEANMDFVKELRAKEIPCQMRVLAGDHNWDYWRRGMEDAIKYVSTSLKTRFVNPMLWADVPDPDVIRVGDWFYLVSTTMHLMPGAPILRSKDLASWETVGYIFDRLTDSPKYDLNGGTVYGRGQWATSLKYHNGRFYALFAPNEPGNMGDTYICSAEKAEGPWTLVSRLPHFHDASLFFDDDGRVYVIYETGKMCELEPDFSAVKEGSQMQIFQREPDETGLLEGSRMIKHNGKYYLLMISWPNGKPRRQVCYRADDIHGPYEKKCILETVFGGASYIGQGTIVDGKDGQWYGIIFQDRTGVGRILTALPCHWIDGWPILGDKAGHVPATMPKLALNEPFHPLVTSDDFNANKLNILWQWNHNPVDNAWSLTERPGFLRLKTSRVVDNLYMAPNTISQRTEGPACCATVQLDLSHLKDGDCAGFAVFNGHSGVLTVRKEGGKMKLSMSEQVVNLDRDKIVKGVETTDKETVSLKTKKVWLRIDADFMPGKDIAKCYYSTDGKQWQRIGSDYKMRFDWQRLFMGTRFAIFCYATKQVGGYVDIDDFEYKNYATK